MPTGAELVAAGEAPRLVTSYETRDVLLPR